MRAALGTYRLSPVASGNEMLQRLKQKLHVSGPGNLKAWLREVDVNCFWLKAGERKMGVNLLRYDSSLRSRVAPPHLGGGRGGGILNFEK